MCSGVIGYAMTFAGTATLDPTNENTSIIPQPIKYVTIVLPPPPSSERVLMADATLSLQNNEANRANNGYSRIQGGSVLPDRTSHLNGTMPLGGNVAMLDSHVEWRKFPQMHVRTLSAPYFWW
jgi:prepilin-type processing-associated H-X9-DG protein